MNLRTDLPIANQRRSDLLRRAYAAMHTGAPMPSVAEISEAWGVEGKTVSQYLARFRRWGWINTERRGRRIYVVEVRG